MPTTAHDLQRERILAAVRLSAVADAAGVVPSAWASTTSPRVHVGDGSGFIRGLHRGRLPAVEVWQAEDTWDRLTAAGGNILTTWVLRAHVPDLTLAAADARARAILLVALAAMRSDAYLDEGEETFGQLQPGPLGHMLEARVTLVHTYDRSTYETDATITPGSPVVVIPSPGGYTLRFAFNDASPLAVFTMPAGQALDRIEVHVEEAWDGTGAAVTLGTSGDPVRFFASTEVELDAQGATFEKDFDTLPGPVSIVANLTPGTGATAGRVRVQVSVTAAGT